MDSPKQFTMLPSPEYLLAIAKWFWRNPIHKQYRIQAADFISYLKIVMCQVLVEIGQVVLEMNSFLNENL